MSKATKRRRQAKKNKHRKALRKRRNKADLAALEMRWDAAVEVGVDWGVPGGIPVKKLTSWLP